MTTTAVTSTSADRRGGDSTPASSRHQLNGSYFRQRTRVRQDLGVDNRPIPVIALELSFHNSIREFLTVDETTERIFYASG
jgi:hypothetical protein